MAVRSTIFVLDAHVSFMSPAECERAEVDGPDAIVDFFQAYVLPGAGGGALRRMSSGMAWVPDQPVKLTVDCSARNVSAMP